MLAVALAFSSPKESLYRIKSSAALFLAVNLPHCAFEGSNTITQSLSKFRQFLASEEQYEEP
jgi:hypothetical protein